MRNRVKPVGRVLGIRAYYDGNTMWYLLEDVRRVLHKPRLQGIGEREYIQFNRGMWMDVKMRLVSAEAVLRYARMYSDTPIGKWKEALQRKSAEEQGEAGLSDGIVR